MSIICKVGESEIISYVKGSPEKIFELCDKSTVPQNFKAHYEKCTQDGYRVIAVATKSLQNLREGQVKSTKREEAESNLEFLGIVVLENKLKSTTKDVIKKLQDCEVTCKMATGDNILTAISIAKQCRIIQNDKIYIVDVDKNARTGKEFLAWKLHTEKVDNQAIQEDSPLSR